MRPYHILTQLFPSEPLIMALLLEQHKMINWLENKTRIPKQRENDIRTKVI
jgi:hypothetical protein